MNKKLVVVGIVVLLICVGLSGCNEPSIENVASAEINNYEIKDDNGISIIEVEISGNSDLEVVLSIDNNEICSKNIKKRQLDDGSESIYLEICSNKFETPEGGDYKITVYSGGTQIAEKEFFRAGAFLEIIYVNAESEEYSSLKEKYFNEFTVSYENIGDLPAYVSQIYLDSGKDYSYKNVAETSQYIEAGESKTLSSAIFLETEYWYWGRCYIRVSLLDSNGNALSLFYTWNEP